MSKDVLVFVECKKGAVRKAALEVLSKGKEIADSLSASLIGVVAGSGVAAVAEEIRCYADKVIVVDQADLEDYRWDTFTTVMENIINKYAPSLVFGASTATGKDFFPRLAARLGAAIVSDALDIKIDGADLNVKKALFGGKIISWVAANKEKLLLVTFRPNSFGVQNNLLNGQVIEEKIQIAKDPRIRVVNIERTDSKKVDLQEADFIICGGRGMKGPEQFQVLEEIAEVMCGRVGASRAVVDAKWRDYDDQVGKSGKTVSPKLYVGVGVSGALHHTMGMDTSKVIVAVNKDPNAPIFQYADYGIVDDIFAILPILKEELKKAKEEV